MSQLPYINETHKQEHEKEANAKRSLLIGYDSDTLTYNKAKVNSDGKLAVDATVTATVDTTGLATSAKQLPDNHQVTVSNIASTPVITGFATSAKQDTQTTLLQGIAGFTVTGYDYIGASYPDTSTEVYTYKTGGSGGSTIATITVVYSDPEVKNVISSVTKT